MSYALQSRVQLSHDLATSSMKLNPSSDNSPEAIRAVAEEFESLFMNMMLKSMRSANRVLSEDNYFNSFESKMYEDMLDEKLSVSLSKHGSLGIADLLEKQLTPAAPRRQYDLKMQPVAVQPFPAERREAFLSQQHFVETLLPEAKKVAAELGIKPEFVLAQAALETGWGQHVMFSGDGVNSHNLFGIKSRGTDWPGQTLTIESLEVSGGVASPVKSTFKMYADYEEALQDYQSLLSEGRYEGIKNAKTVRQFAEGLRAGGYATDPQYVEKIARVFDSLNQLNLALRRN